MKTRSLLLIPFLALGFLAACPPAAASPPGAGTETVTPTVADSFRISAAFTIADPTKTAFTVNWRVTFADSVGGAVLRTIDVPVGTTATIYVSRTLAPGERFTVGVSAQGMNQNNELSVAGPIVYAGYTALVGAPSPGNPATVSICRVGDVGCN
jgi:hypothetical protein